MTSVTLRTDTVTHYGEFGCVSFLLSGTRDAIDKARALVEASLEEYARQNVSINFDATKHASMLIGNKGAKINALRAFVFDETDGEDRCQ